MNMKLVNDMSEKELRYFGRLISLGVFIIWPFFTFMFTFNLKQPFTKVVLTTSVTLELFCLINLVLISRKSFILKSFYFGCSTIFYLIGCNFYLISMEYLIKSDSLLTKTIIFLNIFIVSLTLMIKRLIIKNSKYINALKLKKHQKYIISDLILAFVVGLVVIFIAELFDLNSFVNITSNNDLGRILIGYILFILLSTIFVYGLVFYFYEAKNRKI